MRATTFCCDMQAAHTVWTKNQLSMLLGVGAVAPF